MFQAKDNYSIFYCVGALSQFQRLLFLFNSLPHDHIFPRLLLYVAGVVYFYYLTSDEMSRRGYFDENALMTGLVRREFSDQRSIAKHADDIKKLGGDRYACILL